MPKSLLNKGKIFSSVVVLLSSLGVLLSLGKLRSENLVEQAEAHSLTISGERPRYRLKGLREEASDLHSMWQRALSVGGTLSPETHYKSGRAALVAAFSNHKIEDKARLVCEAYRSFRRAARRAPRQTQYQIAWADVAAQLKNPQKVCPQLISDWQEKREVYFDPLERLRWATSLSPFGLNELYMAAVTYLGMGQKNEALSLLKTSQEFNPFFSKEQKIFTYDLVTKREELELALPNSYPEILSWVSYFEKQRQADYENWKEVFASGLDRALDRLESRFHKRSLSETDYAEYTKKLSKISLSKISEPLRNRFDSMLANVYEIEGNSKWASLLKKRKNLRRIPVLKSAAVQHKKLQSQMLGAWLPDETEKIEVLDQRKKTLGIYIPEGFEAILLVLENSRARGMLDAREIEILFSEDNLSYYPYHMAERMSSQSVDGKQVIASDLKGIPFRYLKLRYSGEEGSTIFANALTSLIQVYGVAKR